MPTGKRRKDLGGERWDPVRLMGCQGHVPTGEWSRSLETLSVFTEAGPGEVPC